MLITTSLHNLAGDLCKAVEEIIHRYGGNAEAVSSAMAVVTRFAVRGLIAERGPRGAAEELRRLADEIERGEVPGVGRVH